MPSGGDAMKNISETVDRRDCVDTPVNQLPTPSVWMDTNLPWNSSFWEKITSKTLMRLNPHWHIAKKNGAGYPVEDVLTEADFNTTPEIEFDGEAFRARFPEIGLTLAACSRKDGINTALSYDIIPVDNGSFTSEDAGRTMQYWLPSLREYYRLHKANSLKNRFWRFFMDKVMLTMNPTQRRISGFMFKLTVLEALFIVILGVGWHFYGA